MVHLKSCSFHIGSGGIDRLLKRCGFSREVNEYAAIATYNCSVVASGFEECIALIVRYIGHVGQYKCEVVGFHASIDLNTC